MTATNGTARFLTTGDLQRLLHVGETTVRGWCARGLIPSQSTAKGHRRIRVEDAAAFLDRQGYHREAATLLPCWTVPALGLSGEQLLAVAAALPRRVTLAPARSEFDLGLMVADWKPWAVLLGPAAGRTSAKAIAASLGRLEPAPRLLIIAPEDGGEGWPGCVYAADRPEDLATRICVELAIAGR